MTCLLQAAEIIIFISQMQKVTEEYNRTVKAIEDFQNA